MIPVWLGFEVPLGGCGENGRNFKSKADWNRVVVSVPLIPKFASKGAAGVSELRNRDTGVTDRGDVT